jgi:hypothetical protein
MANTAVGSGMNLNTACIVQQKACVSQLVTLKKVFCLAGRS